MIKLKPVAIFLAAALATGVAQADQTWDLAADYSLLTNPNNAWSYGWKANLAGALNLFDTVNGWQWYDSAHHSGDNTPTVWKNFGGGTSYGVASGETSLHAGWDYSIAVARWTSPVTGLVTIEGYFGAGDMGNMSYYIATDGLASQYWKNQYDTQHFSFTQLVHQGQTIEFEVGTGTGDYGFGNTPVMARITAAVPEPETYAMLMAGLAVLGGVARRRKAA